ncbi:uncharacterized protein LOC121375550 isoform X2 [Gigantopelta aegis]|uniref:uncharacterized protein LOC121375550 isoform X2 n=1 Tax=Gigantopelta aegis TaxID=1735272 RepID=UPI001B887AC5|nr:uncharacterized protein LOC121375550 isoform X2 [Gigantopelta aegis]
MVADLKADQKKTEPTMEQRIVKNILKKNAEFLTRHLVLSPSVLDKMHTAGIISDVARKQIIFQVQRKQVPMLLQNLEGHGLVTIRKFLEVLRETGHSWLVGTILDTEAMSYEDVTPHNTRREPQISSGRHPGLLTPDWNKRPAAVQLGNYVPPLDYKPAQATSPTYVSLGKLLDDRQKLQDQPKPARGQLQPKVILEDVMNKPLQFTKANEASTFEEDVPTSLVNLQGYFKGQCVTNEQTLSVLKQEEVAIRELLEQNIRDQAKLRRNQHALGDIASRLEEIHVKAGDVYNPTTHAQLSRYRLAQLNQIPWRDEN